MNNIIASMSHPERIYVCFVILSAFLNLARKLIVTMGEGEVVSFLKLHRRASDANVYRKLGWVGFALVAIAMLILHAIVMMELGWAVSTFFVTTYYLLLAFWQAHRIADVSQDKGFLNTFA